MIWDYIKHFEEDEFAPAPENMDPQFLLKLDRARELAGVPFVINSSWRRGDSGAHPLGLAVDIEADTSAVRYHVVDGALKAGFIRIGVYDKHVHLDDWSGAPSGYNPVMWWGESQ